MDRRSWLWRRKSSEKVSGETESSGSISSLSERFSDEQAYPNNQTQSPEVTSKAAPSDEELNDSVKTLTEKLSEALLNISAKEDLVKQHAKVAEEAVSGWEKAENEVLSVKQKLDTATQKNSALEDRVNHLDGALKECVRQLRQAREEQEHNIHEEVAKKTREWESTKSSLEGQVLGLQAKLDAFEARNVQSSYHDLLQKLEAAEKENSKLKLELLSKIEDLELRTIERDLNAQSAEAASKQHLESTKKVAKLEAECRRLKAAARKASPAAYDHRSVTASSICVESFTDSQSDSGERLLEQNECEPSRSDSWTSALIAELDHLRSEKSPGRTQMVRSTEINLMDDFLEMERLASLPEAESATCCHESGASLGKPNDSEKALRAELESMINRSTELEKQLRKMEEEKLELEMALSECQHQLKTSRDHSKEAEAKILELQTQLAMENEARAAIDGELETTKGRREEAESRLVVVESELNTLLLKVASLEDELENERDLSCTSLAKCEELESEIMKMNREAELWAAARSNAELKMKQDKELGLAASKFAECQKTIASLGKQLKSLATLEDFLTDSEKLPEIIREESQLRKDAPESKKLYFGDLYNQKEILSSS